MDSTLTKRPGISSERRFQSRAWTLNAGTCHMVTVTVGIFVLYSWHERQWSHTYDNGTLDDHPQSHSSWIPGGRARRVGNVVWSEI